MSEVRDSWYQMQLNDFKCSQTMKMKTSIKNQPSRFRTRRSYYKEEGIQSHNKPYLSINLKALKWPPLWLPVLYRYLHQTNNEFTTLG